MDELIKLNLGCDLFKIPDFINIDINGSVSPDLCINLKDLKNLYQENSVDFIYAGHILEHLDYKNSLNLLKDCYTLLKPCSSIIVVVPDYTKCGFTNIDIDEKVILGNQDHKILFNKTRLEDFFKNAGFLCYTDINDLKKIPYLIVSDNLNPIPDKWQTAMLGIKI